MKIAIVGSRDYPEPEEIRRFVRSLTDYLDKPIIVSGGARGVDSIAEAQALYSGLETLIFPAEWDKYGKKAGFLRNKLIVEAADRVAAFWDGTSVGTLHTINLAQKAGKDVAIFFPEGYTYVFTDGSGTSRGNPGGWAYAIVQNGLVLETGASGESDTTNNQMELMAAIMGLSAASKRGLGGKPVTLVTDSEYVVTQALKKHRTKANIKLVKALQTGMVITKAKAKHVRGHSGIPFNELVDDLAGVERKKFL